MFEPQGLCVLAGVSFDTPDHTAVEAVAANPVASMLSVASAGMATLVASAARAATAVPAECSAMAPPLASPACQCVVGGGGGVGANGDGWWLVGGGSWGDGR